MKKGIIMLAVLAFVAVNSFAQSKYGTREGTVTFTSDTPMEKIEGTNEKASTVLDGSNGNVEFAILIKGFQFKQALMQEHFNENYMESDKFPKATFKGAIQDFDKVNLEKDGTYSVVVKGNLTMHGVTKPVETKGTITVKGGAVNAKGTFNVKAEDYDISIPSVVREKIAKSIKIDVNCNYKKLK